MQKVVKNAIEVINGLTNNMSVSVRGFDLCSIPENCIQAIFDSDINGLTCYSNNAGVDGWGLGLLLQKHQIKKMIASYVFENKEFERQLL